MTGLTSDHFLMPPPFLLPPRFVLSSLGSMANKTPSKFSLNSESSAESMDLAPPPPRRRSSPFSSGMEQYWPSIRSRDFAGLFGLLYGVITWFRNDVTEVMYSCFCGVLTDFKNSACRLACMLSLFSELSLLAADDDDDDGGGCTGGSRNVGVTWPEESEGVADRDDVAEDVADVDVESDLM